MCVCGECLIDSLVQWDSSVTRSSRGAAVCASQILSISAWVRSFIPPKVVQALASCWRTTTEIPMKPLSKGAVRFTYFQWRRILGPEALLMLQAGTVLPQPARFGRVQVRVGGKDPILFGMLSTAFLFLEQIHSFWMGFTEQNASGWEPTKQVIKLNKSLINFLITKL